jgi:hypothetical protein
VITNNFDNFIKMSIKNYKYWPIIPLVNTNEKKAWFKTFNFELWVLRQKGVPDGLIYQICMNLVDTYDIYFLKEDEYSVIVRSIDDHPHNIRSDIGYYLTFKLIEHRRNEALSKITFVRYESIVCEILDKFISVEYFQSENENDNGEIATFYLKCREFEMTYYDSFYLFYNSNFIKYASKYMILTDNSEEFIDIHDVKIREENILINGRDITTSLVHYNFMLAFRSIDDYVSSELYRYDGEELELDHLIYHNVYSTDGLWEEDLHDLVPEEFDYGPEYNTKDNYASADFGIDDE